MQKFMFELANLKFKLELMNNITKKKKLSKFAFI